MITGKTKSGFEYSIPESHFDDMRLVDALSEATAQSVSRAILLILGKEQKEALYQHVQREDGTVPAEAVTDEILEIFQTHAKNS